MVALRIIFMGTAELSCASLEKLVAQASSLPDDGQDARPTVSIAAVVTQPDKPKGRDLKLQPSPVKTLALKLTLPVLQPARARDEQFIAELRALQPDLIVVVAYGHILPPAILDLPKFGCLNVHTSLLPKYRGAGPIQWAIANGESETGVTVMKMDAGMDTGPIISQARIPILPTDDSASLHDKLATLGANLLLDTIPGYVAGKLPLQLQPAEGASHAPKIKKEDGRIDWNLPAMTILNRLRAFTPWPGAFTFLPGKPKPHLLKIWKASIGEEIWHKENPLVGLGLKPGTILTANKDAIIIVCGKDFLVISELQLEGGRRMNAAEFLAGHALNAGERFSG